MACPIPRVPPVTRAVCPASENIDGNAEDVMLFERLQLVAVRKSKKGCRWSKAEEVSDVVVLLWAVGCTRLSGVKANIHFFTDSINPQKIGGFHDYHVNLCGWNSFLTTLLLLLDTKQPPLSHDAGSGAPGAK